MLDAITISWLFFFVRVYNYLASTSMGWIRYLAGCGVGLVLGVGMNAVSFAGCYVNGID